MRTSSKSPRARRRGVSPRPGSAERNLERLEERIVPAKLELASGLLSYAAEVGELNRLNVETVTITGTRFLRIAESGSGVLVDATPGGGLIQETATSYRVRASDLTGLSILTDDRDDQLTVGLSDDLPANTRVVMGDQSSTGDRMTIVGTTSDDSIRVDPRRDVEGFKGLRVERAGKVVQLAAVEHLTIDLSGAGVDTLSIDRYATGTDRPGGIDLIGGGTGSDRLDVTVASDFTQEVELTEGAIQINDFQQGSQILLGPSDNVALDQPKVAVEVIEYDANGAPVAIGPNAFNTLLLDTGATSILFTAEPTAELYDGGYRLEGQFLEYGIGGEFIMDVSAEYRFDFAGDSGERNTIETARLLSSETLNFSFFGPWGIVGMPAMVDRVTEVDMSHWIDPLAAELLSIRTDFHADPTVGNGHRYHTPLELFEFPVTGQINNGPIPTMAPLPFIPTKIRDDGHEVLGNFLLDTGAQLSIISTQTAIALGLDKDGDGNLLNEALDSVEVGGLGGSTIMPLIGVDRMAVPTDEGTDLVWTELLMGVLDIETGDGPRIDGVFGMDFLTSGWAAKILPLLLGIPGSDENGYFQTIGLDFREASDLQGDLLFDVIPERDEPAARSSFPLSISHVGFDEVAIATGSGDDRFTVDPSVTVAYSLDGSTHAGGDTLKVEVPEGLTATVHAGSVVVPGFLPIQYTRIENIDVGSPPPPPPSTAIIDDGAAGFSTVGAWPASTLPGFQGDSLYSLPGSGSNVASWSFAVTPGSTYTVMVTYPAHANSATNARYVVRDGVLVRADVPINQRVAPDDVNADGANWEVLGNVTMTGDTLLVQLGNLANGNVRADAVRIVQVNPLEVHDATPPPKGADVVSIDTATLQSVAQSAIKAWARAGLDADRLERMRSAQLIVRDLPDGLLGLSGEGIVQIDDDAAGYGWSLLAGRRFERQDRFSVNTGDGGFDLLTVVAHELGHVIGLGDLDHSTHSRGLMASVLAPGVRRLPQPTDLPAETTSPAVIKLSGAGRFRTHTQHALTRLFDARNGLSGAPVGIRVKLRELPDLNGSTKAASDSLADPKPTLRSAFRSRRGKA